MTKKAIAATLLTLSLAFATSALAKDASSTGTARKDLMQQKIDTRKQTIQTKLDDLKAKMASREAALKVKLETFKDKQKALTAERVNTNLNKINQNQTSQMQKYLDTMTSILNKLDARVTSGKPDIKDPALARLAIASASAKIASASSAVSAQAQKDYTIQVGSETTIKADAKAQRERLHKDLMTLRKIVIDAKQAVSNAIRVARSGKLEIPGKEATQSGR